MTITFLYSPPPRQPPPLPCVHTNTNGNYALGVRSELYSMGSVPGIEFAFFLQNKKGHSHSALFHCLRIKQDGQTAGVDDLSLRELLGKADFQADERRPGSPGRRGGGKQRRVWVCALACEPHPELLAPPRLAGTPGQRLVQPAVPISGGCDPRLHL